MRGSAPELIHSTAALPNTKAISNSSHFQEVLFSFLFLLLGKENKENAKLFSSVAVEL